MNKEEFLNSLNAALEKNGLSEGKRKKVIRTFEMQIDSVAAEESEALISSFGDPDKIASELKKSLDERKIKKENSLAVRTSQEKSVAIKEEADDGNWAPKTARTTSTRGQAFFYGGLAILSPVWLFLCMLIVAAFAAIFALIFGVDVILTVGIILGAIVSILLSIVGILYGIIGILPGGVESYVGLYEMGLGIMILGILVVVSILVYHYIVKITPILVKLTIRLAKYTFIQIKKFVKFVRKECDKL